MACCAGCSRDSNKTVEELNNKAMTLLQQNKSSKALKTITLALKKAEREHGAENLATVKCLETMALAYQANGNLQKAESTYKKALAIITKISGRNSIDAAKIMNNLGGLYYAEKKYGHAVDFFKQSLAIVKKKFPADDPRLETIRKNIKTCETLQKGGNPSQLAEKLSSINNVKDLVPAQVKQAMLTQLAKQNIFISNLRPQPMIRVDNKGIIFPYRALKKGKEGSGDVGQEIVVLFAAVKNPAKQNAYIFQQCRILAYQSYMDTIHEGGIELLKKKLKEIFPGLYS